MSEDERLEALKENAKGVDSDFGSNAQGMSKILRSLYYSSLYDEPSTKESGGLTV